MYCIFTFFRELGEIDFAVRIAGADKVIVNAFSNKLTVIQNKDQICLTDTCSTLGHQEGGNISTELMERSAKCSICCKIQSTGTVVKNQKFRFLYNARAIVRR